MLVKQRGTIERLLRAVVSQDIMSIMQSNSVVDSSNLQTELERTKERFENCIIKKENEYAKLWNDWYKKCEECKYDKISKDTPYVSNTLDPLSQKLENENVELEFQVSEQKDTTHGTSTNTKFAKQSIKPPSSSRPKLYVVTPLPKSKAIPKIDESHALSKPVTSNSVPTPTESKVVKNDNVISPGIFRINPFKASRVDNFVPNKHVKASVRTKPITVSQPHVITKNDVNSKTNGFSPKDVKSTTRTRRPQPRNNPKSDKVPFKSKSSCLSNKLEKNMAFLPVSESISKSRQVFNDMTFNINQFIEIVDQTWRKHTSSCFRVPTAHDMELLIKTFLMPLSIKSQNDSFRFEHELKTEMHEDYEYVKSLEKEVDELESEKADFSNIYDLLLEECVSKDVTCSYLHSLSDLNAYAELQCLYLHKVKECECLAQKLSKQTESVNNEVHNKLLKSFAKLENHSISLKLALQQCKEQMKNNSVCKENGSNVFRKEREQYHEIQDLKAQMQDKNIAISELKKLIEKCKGKSVETQFDKPYVVRQPNAQRIPKPSVLGKPTPFSNSPEMRSFQMKQSVNKTNVSDGLFKQVTQQNLPQNRKQAEIHSNVLKPGMYRIATTTTQNREPQLPHASRNTNPHVSKSSGVNHTTSVSRPQLKCYQVKDKVVPNNSQVKFKKKEVEDHHRISSISKKTKSVTACNDSSNSRT
ncbi:hypothetical protein Tco_0522320 [Tanacetum coccineum]